MKELLRLCHLSAASASCAALMLPAHAGHAAVANVVKNSSFEAGTDGYAIQRAEYLRAGQREVPYLPLALDASTAFHGARSLRIDNSNAGSWRFMTRAFPVDPGKRYVISFAAKAGAEGQDLVVNLDTAQGPYDEVGKSFSLSTRWKRYSFGPVAVPGGKSLCNIQMMHGIYSRPKVGTSLWLDALQVLEVPSTPSAGGNDQAADARYAAYTARPLELGIANGLKRQYTESSQQNFPVRFVVRNNSSAPAWARLRYRVRDEYFQKIVARGEVKPFAVAANALATRALSNVSPKKRGKFVLEVDLLGADGAVQDQSEFDFAVIDSVRRAGFTEAFSVSDIANQGGGRPMGPEGESRDLYVLLGASADEFFDFRAQAGDRWIRSWDFNWSNIEPQSGRYNWALTDIFVRKARERGIRVFPTFGDEFILDNNRDVPQWIRDDPQSTIVPRTVGGGQVLLPPLDKWTRYIRACVSRYKGTINAWEVLNEPNLYITSDKYLLYLKSAYETIKAVDPSARVVAFSSSQDYGGAAVQYLEESFQKGALNYCDVVGFHPYGARLDWSSPLTAQGMNAQIRALMNRYGGAEKELWCTEIYHLGKPGGPGQDDNYLGRVTQGHEAARRYLIDLSTGLGRSFTALDLNYLKLFLPQSWAVNNHLTMGMSPSNTFVVYNTLARLFEGAKPAGQVALEGKGLLYLYAKAGSPIAAAWSSDWDNKPSALVIPRGAGRLQVLDIMGNPSEQAKRRGQDLVLELSNTPLYILPATGAQAQFRALLQGAKAAQAGA